MKLLAIIFTLFPFIGISQSRIITAQILDSETKEPIRNATITIHEQDSSVFSNHLGYFQTSVAAIDQLIISHIGYTTSEVKIPESNSFVILLEKKYANLGAIDLNSFPLQTDQSNSILLVENEMSNIKNGAIYKDNWQKFYKDIGELIVKSPSYSMFENTFEVQVHFTISEFGKVENVITHGESPSPLLTEKEIIIESLLSLNHWTPATQNGKKSYQFFELGVLRNKEIFTIVEEMATPIGGFKSFYDYINSNLYFPTEAKRLGIEGRVMVQFVVNTDGELTEIEVVKGIGAGCDQEAIRLIKNSPHWYPPYQRGKPVRQRMVLPITFDPTLSYSLKTNSFNEYISSRIRYPRQGRKMGIEGTVYATFQIDDSKQHVVNTNILNSMQNDFGDEIKLVLNSVPSELIENDFKANHVYILPVKFGLVNYPKNTTEVNLPQGQKLEDVVVIANKSYVPPSPTLNLNTGRRQYFSIEQALEHDSTIQKLSIVEKGLTDISPKINKLGNLIFLDLEGNNITKLPKELAELPKLQELYLPNNKISSLPDQFHLLSSLKIVGLANNQLSEFPKQLTQLSKLEALDLSGNSISVIPKEINNLKKLKVLYLNNNHIQALPPEIYSMKKLEQIYLINNELTQTQILAIKSKFKKIEVITE